MTVTCFPAQCVNPICHFQRIFKSKPYIDCGREAKQRYSAYTALRTVAWCNQKKHSSRAGVNLKTVQTKNSMLFFCFSFYLTCSLHTCSTIDSFLLMYTGSWFARGKPLPTIAQTHSLAASYRRYNVCRGCQKLIWGHSLKEIKRHFHMRLNLVLYICMMCVCLWELYTHVWGHCVWICRHIIWIKMLCFVRPLVAGVHAGASFVIMSNSSCFPISFSLFLSLSSCLIMVEGLLETEKIWKKMTEKWLK